MKGLYIHIPFCQKRCHYCDFTTMVSHDEALKRAYLFALEKELENKLLRYPKFRTLDTIFIGGGTPTSLSEENLRKLLEMVKKYYPPESVLEYTIEANPNTLNDEKIALLKAYGISRISLGVQSFEDEKLAYLGRAHSSNTVKELIPKLRVAGFLRINVDLMYGLPKMDLASWQYSIKEALALGVDHLSLYQLKVEENTLFEKWQEEGRFLPFSEDLAKEMLLWHSAYLKAQGFLPYEVSNFAKKGQASLHNQLYWQLHDYLAIGLGATGFIRPLRYTNETNLSRYIKADGEVFCEVEQLSLKEQMAETMMMGLRQIKGISKRRFEALYQTEIEKIYPKALKALLDKGLLLETDGYYALSEKGRPLANEVFMAFL